MYTTPTSFWYVVYIVYEKVDRKWIASVVCLVAELQAAQDVTRLFSCTNIRINRYPYARVSIEHVLGTPLLPVFGMLFILYIKR